MRVEAHGSPDRLSKTSQVLVLDQVRDLILEGRLRPGERLIETELASRFEVSRTPIREALQSLAAEGLVELSPRKGASVVDLSLDEIEDIYDIRIAIEGLGGYLAAAAISSKEIKRLEALLGRMKELFDQGDRWELLDVNRTFYEVLYSAADRPRLHKLIMRYLDLAGIYRRMAFALDAYFANTITLHERILEALLSRDAEQTSSLISEGLKETAEALTIHLGRRKRSGSNRTNISR